MADYPIYPDAQPETNMPGIQTYHVLSASPDDVIAFYEGTMQEAGWTLEGKSGGGGNLNLDFEKGDQAVTVSAVEDGSGGSVITILEHDD